MGSSTSLAGSCIRMCAGLFTWRRPRAWAKTFQVYRRSRGRASMSIKKPNLLLMVSGLLGALLASAAAGAQSVTGTISGTATDSSGGVIAGAAVTLLNERTGDARKLSTNEEGRLIFSAVQPGPYTVRIGAQGF